jgi:peptide/nickel transport system substrate-binding protein
VSPHLADPTYLWGPNITYAMLLNTKRPPLNDPDVRRALNYAIDRQTISDTILQKDCAPTSQAFASGSVGYDKTLDGQYSYDPEKAKAMLAKAGHPSFTIDALVIPIEPYVSIASALQAQLKQVGVSLSLRNVPPNQVNAIFNAGQGDAEILHTGRLLPDPTSYVNTFFLGAVNPGKPDNLPAGFADQARAAAATDIGSAARQQAYAKLNEMLTDSPIHIFICSEPPKWAGSSKVLNGDLMAGTRSSYSTADTTYLEIAKR